MKSGDVMVMGRREDEKRRYADLKAGGGLHLTAPSTQQPQSQLPLCTALCDFDVTGLDPHDFKDCLTFLKVGVVLCQQSPLVAKHCNSIH